MLWIHYRIHDKWVCCCFHWPVDLTLLGVSLLSLFSCIVVVDLIWNYKAGFLLECCLGLSWSSVTHGEKLWQTYDHDLVMYVMCHHQNRKQQTPYFCYRFLYWFIGHIYFFSLSFFFFLYFLSSMLLLFSSGWLVKQDKALYMRYSVAALSSIYRKFLFTIEVSVVEKVVNLAANTGLNWDCELQVSKGLELLNWDGLSPG